MTWCTSKVPPSTSAPSPGAAFLPPPGQSARSSVLIRAPERRARGRSGSQCALVARRRRAVRQAARIPRRSTLSRSKWCWHTTASAWATMVFQRTWARHWDLSLLAVAAEFLYTCVPQQLVVGQTIFAGMPSSSGAGGFSAAVPCSNESRVPHRPRALSASFWQIL